MRDTRGGTGVHPTLTCVTGMRCPTCAASLPQLNSYHCPHCGTGGLEFSYDYDRVRSLMSADVGSSPEEPSMWRYSSLLPIRGRRIVGTTVGWTPLIRANRLAAAIGVGNVYVKDDSVNRPTLSYKDRLVSVAINRALEMGLTTVGCVSTGNVANSTASFAAAAGLNCVVVVPGPTETGKLIGSIMQGAKVVRVRGTYDEANRVCRELLADTDIGFVNINLRSYYSEGAKTIIFEIAEQMNWRLPSHIILPLAGGNLVIKAQKAVDELRVLRLIDPASRIRIHGAQAAGSAPIAAAFRSGVNEIVPVEPKTIATSLAIGNPGDAKKVLEAIRSSAGTVGAVADDDIVEGMRTLAKTEGIFAEAAGGTTVGYARQLADQGVLREDEDVVLVITGNGYKTPEPVLGDLRHVLDIEPDASALRQLVSR